MIFFGRRNRKSPPDYSQIKTDIHSHLLPGIDDGVSSMEMSLDMIRTFHKLGYRKLITTPHVMWDMFKNTPEIIRAKLNEVRAAVKKEGIPIEIGAAAEYFIDDHFEEMIRKKEPLLTLKDKLVLVEFSMISMPFELKEVFFSLQMSGYQPVVAHPERYVYLDRNRQFYHDLKAAGCLFQCNLLSLAGYYGRKVQELSKYLAKNGFYDFVGSDAHSPRHMEGLKSASLKTNLDKLIETCLIRNVSL